ncbi:hypothetical protein BS78_10G084000 [Paspalum vaginatum]|nr:hypothetical protein BS78_10G084000 [Paspalum vaginatum]
MVLKSDSARDIAALAARDTPPPTPCRSASSTRPSVGTRRSACHSQRRRPKSSSSRSRRSHSKARQEQLLRVQYLDGAVQEGPRRGRREARGAFRRPVSKDEEENGKNRKKGGARRTGTSRPAAAAAARWCRRSRSRRVVEGRQQSSRITERWRRPVVRSPTPTAPAARRAHGAAARDLRASAASAGGTAYARP